MYCENCGSIINENSNYCSNCGVKVKKPILKCEKCGFAIKEYDTTCDNCGQVIDKNKYNNQYNSTYSNSESYNTYTDNSPIQNFNKKQKSKIVAGILGVLVGALGIHRFYLGYIGIGIVQIILTILTGGIASLWGFIEGILILCGTGITTDADGIPLSND